MTIKEFILIAEKFYGNDENANAKGSSLSNIKIHSEIALQYIHDHPEIVVYNLTEVELLSIIMLEGFAHDLIQLAAFDPQKMNGVSKILIDALDSALLKIEKNSESVLYRNDDHDFHEYKIGQRIKISGFFTTSKDDYNNAQNIKWVITPLPSPKTKAHEVYRVYNHGIECPYPEFQIEYERGATFVVMAIEEGTPFKTIHIKEIES